MNAWSSIRKWACIMRVVAGFVAPRERCNAQSGVCLMVSPGGLVGGEADDDGMRLEYRHEAHCYNMSTLEHIRKRRSRSSSGRERARQALGCVLLCFALSTPQIRVNWIIDPHRFASRVVEATLIVRDGGCWSRCGDGWTTSRQSITGIILGTTSIF